MQELVVLQHTPQSGTSAFTEVLDGRTGTIAPWRSVVVAAGEALPTDLDALAGLIVMGGPVPPADGGQDASTTEELDLLRRAVAAELPVLGVGLGAQLLGVALGGELTARAVPDLAYVPLHHTEGAAGDPLIGGWPDGAQALLVHVDEVTSLPPDAVALLAGGEGVPAWRAGSAWALHFHPELTHDQLAAWIEEGLLQDLLERAGVDAEEFLAEALRRARFTVPQGCGLLARFLDGPVRERVSG